MKFIKWLLILSNLGAIAAKTNKVEPSTCDASLSLLEKDEDAGCISKEPKLPKECQTYKAIRWPADEKLSTVIFGERHGETTYKTAITCFNRLLKDGFFNDGDAVNRRDAVLLLEHAGHDKAIACNEFFKPSKEPGRCRGWNKPHDAFERFVEPFWQADMYEAVYTSLQKQAMRRKWDNPSAYRSSTAIKYLDSQIKKIDLAIKGYRKEETATLKSLKSHASEFDIHSSAMIESSIFKKTILETFKAKIKQDPSYDAFVDAYTDLQKGLFEHDRARTRAGTNIKKSIRIPNNYFFKTIKEEVQNVKALGAIAGLAHIDPETEIGAEVSKKIKVKHKAAVEDFYGKLDSIEESYHTAILVPR